MSFEQHKNDVYKSTLLPLISTCLNHPGFKYKKNELREVGIVEFMDSVQRLQVYESSTALLKGIYMYRNVHSRTYILKPVKPKALSLQYG